MRINNNLAAASASGNVKKNTNKLSDAMKKLSSGMKINSFADDAAGGAISEKLRGQIRGLDQACRNIGDATNMVHTGDGPLQNIQDMLGRMRELAIQAANDTNESLDRTAMQLEMEELAKEIDRTSQSTDFNGLNILRDSWPRIHYEKTDMVEVSRNALPPTIKTRKTYTNIQIYQPANTAPTTPTLPTPPVTTVTGSIAPVLDPEPITSSSTGGNAECVVSNFDPDRFPDIVGEGKITETYLERSGQDVTTTYRDDVTSDANQLAFTVGNNGFPSFTSALGNSTVRLFCALTEVMVRVGGMETSLYSVPVISQTLSTDGNRSETVYNFNGVEITQVISLNSASDSYDIKLYAENITNPAADRTVSFKLTLDAMNGEQMISNDGGSTFSATDTGGNTVTTPTSNNAYDIANPTGDDIIRISKISGDGAVAPAVLDPVDFKIDYWVRTANNADDTDALGYEPATRLILDNVETMSSIFGYAPGATDQHMSDQGSYHTGVSTFWENMTLKPGEKIKMGASYGDAEFSGDFAMHGDVTEFSENKYVSEVVFEAKERAVYRGRNVVIQTGADEFDELRIPLLNMSAYFLEVDEISVMTHDKASEALGKIDLASRYVSSMRSLWGALENRMGHTDSRNAVAGENQQAAESRIRDADMAKEMAAKVKADVNNQASIAMLAQANSLPQNVLTLLQG